MKTLAMLVVGVVLLTMASAVAGENLVADRFVVCDGYTVIQTTAVQFTTYRQVRNRL